MTRRQYIEERLRNVYGGMPSDDAEITVNLVNLKLNAGIALAAMASRKENIAIEGISAVNNSFYTTYAGLVITDDGDFVYKIALPITPVGIGVNEDIAGLYFVHTNGSTAKSSATFLTPNQWYYKDNLKKPQNKMLAFYESGFVYVESDIPLWKYKAKIRMVSGGNIDLDSTLSVPDGFIPVLDEYIYKQLAVMRQMPQDLSNDGVDKP